MMDVIKLFAFITMFLDHTYIFDLDFRLVGRLAFPMFAFLIAYNALYRTKDIKGYLYRLLLVACLSQPVYAFFYGSLFAPLNIFFTLSAGLFLIMYVKTEIKDHLFLIVGLLALMDVLFYGLTFINYSFAGIFFIYSLAYALEYRKYYILPLSVFFLYPLNTEYFLSAAVALMLAFAVKDSSTSYSFLRSKFMYLVYPGHLLLYKLLHVSFL